jgi:hypothetical protein
VRQALGCDSNFFKVAVRAFFVCEVKLFDGFHHILTAWKTKKDMSKFVLSSIHWKAKKIFPKIATGSTIGYKTDKMPSWDEALLMWWKSLVNYN